MNKFYYAVVSKKDESLFLKSISPNEADAVLYHSQMINHHKDSHYAVEKITIQVIR